MLGSSRLHPLEKQCLLERTGSSHDPMQNIYPYQKIQFHTSNFWSIILNLVGYAWTQLHLLEKLR